MKELETREIEVVELLRNISGENEERINNVLLALMIYTLMQYASNQSIIVPYLGSLKLRYNGDTITPEGKEADLDIFFNPSSFLKQNIGEYEDTKKKDLPIVDVSIIKYLIKKNERSLRTILNEEEIDKIDD